MSNKSKRRTGNLGSLINYSSRTCVDDHHCNRSIGPSRALRELRAVVRLILYIEYGHTHSEAGEESWEEIQAKRIDDHSPIAGAQAGLAVQLLGNGRALTPQLSVRARVRHLARRVHPCQRQLVRLRFSMVSHLQR